MQLSIAKCLLANACQPISVSQCLSANVCQQMPVSKCLSANVCKQMSLSKCDNAPCSMSWQSVAETVLGRGFSQPVTFTTSLKRTKNIKAIKAFQEKTSLANVKCVNVFQGVSKSCC